jgi:hypothetical protein
LKWIGDHCDFSPRMAQVYMQIARNWDRLEGQMNANFDSHLDDGGQYDITWARNYLENFRNDDEREDHDDDDDDGGDTDLNTGGCGGPGTGTGTGQHPDTYPKILQLVFTVATFREFQQHVAELANHFHIKAENDSDRLRTVVTQAHCLLVRKKGEAP